MSGNLRQLDSYASIQSFSNFDGSGSAYRTCGFKIAKGVSIEQSIAKSWKEDGEFKDYKGVTDLKTSAKIGKIGNTSINFSSRSRMSYNDNTSAFAQRIAVGISVPISDNVSFYFTPNSTTTVDFKKNTISEPTASIYTGFDSKFNIGKSNCSLAAELQSYDLINNPTAKSKTGFNMIFKVNF